MAGIAQRLKEAMEAKGLKQVDVIRLAEPIGREYNVRIGKSHMSQYLSGKSEPRKDILGVLAKTLEVDESWLAGEETEDTAPENMPAARGSSSTSHRHRPSDRRNQSSAVLSICCNIPGRSQRSCTPPLHPEPRSRPR